LKSKFVDRWVYDVIYRTVLEMNIRISFSLIILSIAISLSFIFPNFNPTQQSAYAASPNTSDLKQDAKQNMNQGNLCNRDDGCKQANEGQQITGNDNTASGFNDQSTTNSSSLITTPATTSPGTPGPAGPAGPQGQVGPPRTLQVVERQGETVEISPGLRGFSEAPCLPGEFATGGGYAYNPTGPNVALTVDTQIAMTGNTGWDVRAVNNSTSPTSLTAFAECASLVP
jgi:hypothetical protein